ncbi:MAG: sensory box histidine kinase [Acidobacteriaceae bacterium]|nr:sensory box histidine kinase [Acidobacteriaceae bacterium]
MASETLSEDLEVASRTVRIHAAPPPQPSTIADRTAALRSMPSLDDLSDEEFCWIATHVTERVAPDGALVFVEDSPSHHMHFIVQGEVHVRRRKFATFARFMGRTGQLTGKLPYSRMKAWGGDGCAYGPVWTLDLHEDLFPAMLLAIPSMGQRCVAVLLDRVREFTRADEQAVKLSALGKLAANLAHELNNPASAALRAAGTLAAALPEEDDAKYDIGFLCETKEELDRYRAWVAEAGKHVGSSPNATAESPLAESDREDKLLAWLEAHAIPNPWAIAPVLAEAALPTALLDSLAASVSPGILPSAIASFAASTKNIRTAGTIVGSTHRIFAIIDAIKDYSYMDQAPIQDVDLAQSLDTTMAMFNSRLANVTVVRAYDPSLPPIRAFGSELNQVWTAIIENALDAMHDRGTLTLSTRLKSQLAFVEIHDTGPGIEPTLTDRIFEPFFTTKPLGTALGLGLDIVQRVVSKHFGTVSVESTPASTCFQVRLPLDRNQVY